MARKKITEEVKEEKKISVPKFTRPEVIEELTIENITDIITSQEIEIGNLERQIARGKACIEHYKKALK